LELSLPPAGGRGGDGGFDLEGRGIRDLIGEDGERAFPGREWHPD